MPRRNAKRKFSALRISPELECVMLETLAKWDVRISSLECNKSLNAITILSALRRANLARSPPIGVGRARALRLRLDAGTRRKPVPHVPPYGHAQDCGPRGRPARCAMGPLSPGVKSSGALLPVEPTSHLGEAIRFFVNDTPKVLMVLTLVVFGMGVVRSFFSPEKTRALLAGKREGIGNVLANALTNAGWRISRGRQRCGGGRRNL